jgi:hypothetical protein
MKRQIHSKRSNVHLVAARDLTRAHGGVEAEPIEADVIPDLLKLKLRQVP